MKAIVRETYGPPEVLHLEDVPVPRVGDGDVLVRVRAASANAGDWHLLRGTPLPFRLVAGLRIPKFRIIGTASPVTWKQSVGTSPSFVPARRSSGNSLHAGSAAVPVERGVLRSSLRRGRTCTWDGRRHGVTARSAVFSGCQSATVVFGSRSAPAILR
jgi:hypothetical protein